MSAAAPLLEIFLELRRRNFPLGVPEYQLAQRALSGPAEVDTRTDLLFLCQTLWAKSEEELAAVADALERVLPQQPTEDEVKEFVRAAEGAPEIDNSPEPEPSQAKPRRRETTG